MCIEISVYIRYKNAQNNSESPCVTCKISDYHFGRNITVPTEEMSHHSSGQRLYAEL